MNGQETIARLSALNQMKPFEPKETDTERDGKWFCSVCGDQKYGWFDLPDGTPVFMNGGCRCERLRQAAEKEAEGGRLRRKVAGMTDDIIDNSRFSKDKGLCNPDAVLKAKEYAQRFPENRKAGKGLLFWGNVGVGKSFLSYCIANEVADQTYTVRGWIDREAGKYVDTKQHYHIYIRRPDQAFNEKLNDEGDFMYAQDYADLVVISDLGREAGNDRMIEFVNSWIDHLYELRTPMIVTTNLTLKQLMDPADRRSPAFDRIMSRCMPIEVRSIGRITARQSLRGVM